MGFFNYPRAALTASNVSVLGVGNSHMFGEGSTSGMAWFSQLAAMFPALTFVNTGIGGQRIQSMIDNIATQVYQRLVSGKINIIFAQEFGNEMANNGRDAAAAHAKWVTYCNMIRTYAANNNRKVYLITVGLHPSGAAATYAETLARIASVQAANALIRTNYRSYCDQFIDLAAHQPFAALFAGGDFTEAGFAASGMYNRATNGDGQPNDRVHMGNAGHTRVANIAADAIRRVRRV